MTLSLLTLQIHHSMGQIEPRCHGLPLPAQVLVKVKQPTPSRSAPPLFLWFPILPSIPLSDLCDSLMVDGLVSSDAWMDGLVAGTSGLLFSSSTRGTVFSHGWMSVHQFSPYIYDGNMLLMMLLMPCFFSCHALKLSGSIRCKFPIIL